jgi:hypothetical protein
MANEPKMYRLIGPDGKMFFSPIPGKLGGYRKDRIYGRLDCPNARMHIAKGKYIKQRVFFADENVAIAAGYRPCFHYMRDKYAAWKSAKS